MEKEEKWQIRGVRPAPPLEIDGLDSFLERKLRNFNVRGYSRS